MVELRNRVFIRGAKASGPISIGVFWSGIHTVIEWVDASGQ